MHIKAKINRITGDWLKQCRKHGWTANTHLPKSYDKRYAELKSRLLNVAGSAVCLHIEEDLDQILARGQFLRGYNLRMMRGDNGRCHSNSASLWEVNREQLDLWTGYALMRDGMWRQHTWCRSIAENRVVETTVPRILYYGFCMTKKEATRFFYHNAG